MSVRKQNKSVHFKDLNYHTDNDDRYFLQDSGSFYICEIPLSFNTRLFRIRIVLIFFYGWLLLRKECCKKTA